MTLIRKYTDFDLNDLMDTWENASKMAHPFLTEEFQAQVRRDIPAIYLPNAETWVAEVNNNVVGFIALIGNEVGAIFLQPDFQGQKIGKLMMDKAKQIHGDLEVEVFKKNIIGRKFYDSYGFKVLEEKFNEASGQQILRMKYICNL